VKLRRTRWLFGLFHSKYVNDIWVENFGMFKSNMFNVVKHILLKQDKITIKIGFCVTFIS
jgi:hypothetical protein